MLFCASFALTACQTTAPTEGAGYELLTPAPDTARYIVANDEPFARQVAAHNRFCRQSAACRR